jgi:predicted ester cyclase
MADDVKTTIRRMFGEAVNNGRVELIDELLPPDFVGHMPDGDLDPEGLKQYIVGWRAGFPDLVCEAYDLVEEGERVAWRVRASGTHSAEFMGIPATGNRIDFDSMNHGRVEGGRLREQFVIMDMVTVMQQLGVMPGPGAQG